MYGKKIKGDEGMIKTQTETFRGFGRKEGLTAQTAVECRFGGEVETVLAANASASLTGAEAGNGEVKYFGKVHFSVVYEDAEKHVCRAEKGVEFTAKAISETCCPAYTVRAKLDVDAVTVRREGASVYLTALLGADLVLYGDESFDYLSDGDFICKRTAAKAYLAHPCGGAAEAEDEFETEFIGDLLFHFETVSVTDVTCETGLVRAEGEINLGILALKGENALVSFERLIPFRAEIPCEQAMAGSCADVRVSVGSANLHAEANEEKEKTTITASFALSVDACLYEEATIDAIEDAFSPDCALKLKNVTVESTGAGNLLRFNERISGKAAISSPVDFTDTFQAVTLQRAEANCVKTEGGCAVEGVAIATLLVLGSDGSHRGVEISLPFSIPVQAEANCRVSVLVCGMNARQKQEGEIEAEATVKLCLYEEKKISCTAIAAAEEGDPIERSDSAISVYIPRAGEGLWELSKQLGKSPDEVTASNPELEFPIKEGQRVVVYRKKTRT